MKLAEAAHILGISLEDVTVDSLNKTYKKLVMAWDPDKCKDPSAKQQYMQITEAYKKLSSVMEGKDIFRGGEQHEIATLMRMFMDMVGMSENDSLPTAALTFGMMFDSHQQAMEEWSTDDDGDGEYDEEDEEEEDDDDEYLQDEYYEDYPQLTSDNHNPSGNNDNAWEPQAKTYSNMNLKDQVSKARLEGDSKIEEEKKQKQAKKRADKRKKQKEKEKKLKDALASSVASLGAVDEDIVVVQNKKVTPQPAETVYSEQEIEKIIAQQKHRLKEELVIAVQDGKYEIVDRIVTYNFPGEMPAAVVQAVTDHLKKEIPSYQLLHKCITDFTLVSSSGSSSSGKKTMSLEDLQSLSKKKIVVLQRLLTLRDPMLDLNGCDESGLSILHKSISLLDIEYTKVIVQVIAEGSHVMPPTSSSTSSSSTTAASSSSSEKPLSALNLNSRCHKKGWAPIHYAVDRNNVEAIQILAQFGANLQATSATDKRLTPLELAKTKLKQAGSNANQKAAIQKCIDELNHQIALQKAQSKKASTAATSSSSSASTETKSSENSTTAKSAPSSSSATKNEGKSASVTTPEKAPKDASESKTVSVASSSDKKKKKGDKKSESTATTPAVGSSTGSQSATGAKKATTTPSKYNKGAAPATPVAPVLVQEISVASRDEMVDRLLAMGFREADCLAAIARYGTDLDQAISWLVERPVIEEVKPKAKEDIVKVVPSDSTEKSGESENSLQQKKEELRRINRAWNAKAEDEKRKLEQQRKLEESKAKEAQLKASSKHEESDSVSKSSSSHPSNTAGSSHFDAKPTRDGKDGASIPSGGHSNKQQSASQSVYSTPTYVVPPGFVAPVAVDPLAMYGGDPNGFYAIPGNGAHSYGNAAMHAAYSNYVYDNTQYGQGKPHSSTYGGNALNSSAFPPLGAGNSDTAAANGQNASNENSPSPIPEVYLTGAIELSAGAKPFVPKSFTPSSLPPPAPAASVATSSTPTLPSTPSSNSLSSLAAGPLASTPLSSTGAFSSAVLPAVNLPVDNGVVSSILPGIGGSSSSFMSGLGSSALGGTALGGSTGSLSSLDNTGLGLGSSSLWSSTTSGLTSGLVSSSLGGDPFASLSNTIAPGFLSSILGSDLGLDTQDHFDFDAGNGYIPDLDSLLSTDGLSEFK